MKQLLLFAVIVFAAVVDVWAQTPGWSALSHYRVRGSNGGDEHVTVDAAGNIFMVADLSLNSSFLSPNFSSTIDSLHNTSEREYLIKLSPVGNYLWSFQLPAAVTDVIGVKTDRSGYVYITGVFKDTGTFGNIRIKPSLLIPNGSHDASVFLAKFKTDGTVIWAKNIARDIDTFTGYVYNMSVADNGNVAISGVFEQKAIIGTDTLTGISDYRPGLPSLHYNNGFNALFDSSGHSIWARCIGGSHWGEGYGVAIDNQSNVYTCGVFGDTAVFGNFVVNDTVASSYLACYSAGGAVKWVSTRPNAALVSIAVSDSSAIFATSDYVAFANFTPRAVYKYNAGVLEWSRDLQNGFVSNLAADAAKNVYLMSNFYVGQVSWIRKFDAAGDSVWNVQPADKPTFHDLSADKQGGLMVVGSSTSFLAVIDSIRLPNSPPIAHATYSAFVARLSTNTGIAETHSSIPFFTIHPNPAQTAVTVSLTANEAGDLRLINTLGQQIYHQSFAAGAKERQINVANLPEGLYYLQVQTLSGKQEAKVLVRH